MTLASNSIAQAEARAKKEAQAEAEMSVAVGFHNLYEPELNGVQYSHRSVPGLEAHYNFRPNWELAGEVRQLNQSTGVGVFRVTEERWELYCWGLYLGDRRPRWQPHWGAGLGWNTVTVKTRLYSETRTDSASDYFKLGARLGCRVFFDERIFLEANAQVHWWNANPGRSWLWGALLGFRF
jgi:hypothetical protein